MPLADGKEREERTSPSVIRAAGTSASPSARRQAFCTSCGEPVAGETTAKDVIAWMIVAGCILLLVYGIGEAVKRLVAP